MGKFRQKPVLGRSALLLVLLITGRAHAAPGAILFSDNFERAALAPWTTTNAGVSGILTGGQVSNSPSRGAYTSNTAVTVTSPTFNTSVPAAELTVWVRRGSDAFSEAPDGNENLIIQYRRADNSWGTLNRHLGGGTPGEIIQESFFLPPDGLHGNFAVRLQQTGGSGFDFDYWHFDDVIVTERAPPPPLALGSCDDFEAGLAGNWTINVTSGSAGTSSATSQSPTQAMFTSEGIVEVVSNVIDTTSPTFSTLSMWIRRGSDAFSEDPDAPGENLVVEYLNDTASWIILETFPPGLPGQTFTRAYAIPADGHHANFQVRFRQTGGSGTGWDFWHVDDVCLDALPIANLLVSKALQTLSDPVSGTSNPLAIPGAIVEYTITVSNEGTGTVDAATLLLTDPLPAGMALFVDTTAGDPIVFPDGATSSGLTYSFASDVTFSNQAGGGAPFNYTPVPDAAGFDPAVTGFQVAFPDTMNAASGGNTPGFELRFQLRIQ